MKQKKDLIAPEKSKEELAKEITDLMSKATGGAYLGRPCRQVARMCYLWIFEHKTELDIKNVVLLARMAKSPENFVLVDIPGVGISILKKEDQPCENTSPSPQETP